jgi:hypothetical protein
MCLGYLLASVYRWEPSTAACRCSSTWSTSFVAHAAGVVLALLQGGELQRISVTTDPGSIPAWYGLSLPGVYLVWALVVVALYYPCCWFARLKETRSDWWIHYL